MKMKMKNPFFCGRRKLSSTSASTTSTASASETFSITGCFLACLSPLRRRNSTIFHYSSAPMQSMIEENERLKSESSIDDLPDLLLTDIFQRLPMNSVFRSKCVSKRWLSLISDPLFAQSYASRQQSLSRPFALFYIGFIPGSEHPCEIGPYCPPFEPESLTFPLNFFTTELQKRQKETCALQLIGSSSDLLLFSGLDQSSSDSYCVCNPLTFQWITLPQPPRRRARYPVVGFMVEGDGTFWVVQILPPKFPSSRLLVFQVYCSGRGKWCSKKVACPRQFESFWAKTTVVYQGIILWMVNNGLLAFDPKTTLIGVIDLPTVEMGRFGVSCGRLHYYEVSSYYPSEPMENPILRVWMMINFEGGEWVLQHSIRYDHLWSSDESLKQFLLLPNTEKYFRWVSSHPIDSEIVFLKCDGQLVTCKTSSACLEVLPCDTKQGIFYRLEWDVIPLVFKPWPTAVVLTSDEIVAASTP